MSKKIEIDYIKSEFLKEDYILKSSEYKDSHSKLEYVCPNGHEHSISWTKWQSGRRCYYCKGNIKHDYAFVRDSLEKEGYSLLSKEYTNSRDKIEYRCPNRHEHSVRFSHWLNGVRCPYCCGKNVINTKYVKDALEKEGYIFLDNKYVNSKTKFNYSCSKGHYGVTNWNNWKTGYRCPDCGGTKTKDIDFVREDFNKNGYILISKEYINCDTKLLSICTNGHEYSVSWSNWHSFNSRCPQCKDWGTSDQESALTCIIKEAGVNFKVRDRTVIPPFELDIVIPEKKIAIEYCGLYWHSEKMGKDYKYHINKLNLCESKGYRLITIFEDELISMYDIVKSRLFSLLHNSDINNKVFARKCDIREVNNTIAGSFCEDNHIQGYGHASVRLGAFYLDELVSVMTFSAPSIAKGASVNEKGTWELNRFCSKKNYNVVGIASKLLKYFENNYQCNHIYSYADRRWSVGNVYDKLGFELTRVCKPNYWYFKDNKKRLHRFGLRKTKDDPKDQTEWEIRKSQGWNRIWDCGNLRYDRIIK